MKESDSPLPSNMAVRVYNDIIRYGRVVRGHRRKLASAGE